MYYFIPSNVADRIIGNATEKYKKMREKRWEEQKMTHNGRKITFELYERLLWKQKFQCAMCRMRLDLTIPQLDHDHQTGEIRGVLCYDCNRKRVGLYERTGKYKGKYYEDIIKKYLENYPAKSLS